MYVPIIGPISTFHTLKCFWPVQFSRTQLEEMQESGVFLDHSLDHMDQTCHTCGGNLKVIPAIVHAKFHGALHLNRTISSSTVDRSDFEQRRGKPAPLL